MSSIPFIYLLFIYVDNYLELENCYLYLSLYFYNGIIISPLKKYYLLYLLYIFFNIYLSIFRYFKK